MMQFFLSALLLGLIYLGARFFVRANPKTLAATLRQIAGVLSLGLAAIFLFSGRFAIWALPAALLGLAILMGGKMPFARSLGRGGVRGQMSRVKTAYFDMELDHETGDMDGVVLSGRFATMRLSEMTDDQLRTLYVEIESEGSRDADSLSLIETYLDSVIAGWREDFHTHGDAGHGGAAGAGPITEEEAYEILGLAPGSDPEAIRAAHRRLMLKIHPDRGGSTVLAAKINEAKDFLLRNHSSTS